MSGGPELLNGQNHQSAQRQRYGRRFCHTKEQLGNRRLPLGGQSKGSWALSRCPPFERGARSPAVTLRERLRGTGNSLCLPPSRQFLHAICQSAAARSTVSQTAPLSIFLLQTSLQSLPEFSLSQLLLTQVLINRRH